MNTAARTLQDYFADPRHAATLRLIGGFVMMMLLGTTLG